MWEKIAICAALAAGISVFSGEVGAQTTTILYETSAVRERTIVGLPISAAGAWNNSRPFALELTLDDAAPAAVGGVRTFGAAHASGSISLDGATRGDLTGSFSITLDTSGSRDVIEIALNDNLTSHGAVDGNILIRYDAGTFDAGLNFASLDAQGAALQSMSVNYSATWDGASGAWNGYQLMECCTFPSDLTQTTVATGVPVPEPATWAMMLAGFALAGLRLRWRRHPDQTAQN